MIDNEQAKSSFPHISFPSIDQYRNAIKRVVDSAKYHQVPIPSVKMMGTVKLHGTNAGIVVTSKGDIYFQSRERVITPENDNAGFATWAHQHKSYFRQLADRIVPPDTPGNKSVQIYGEWCGGNIQKGVGLSKLPKMFVIFAVRVSETAESTDWRDIFTVEDAMNGTCRPEGIYISTEFPVFFMRIDFNKPEHFQNQLQELTLAVEKDCPVARKLLGVDYEGELIGEDIVWEITPDESTPFDLRGLRMKTKGEKHSASKVKTLVSIDMDKVNSIEEFVEYACTENRLQQGLTKLQEKGLEPTVQNTGEYLKWISSDIAKEELDTLSASGLTMKDVGGKISAKARNFYLENLA